MRESGTDQRPAAATTESDEALSPAVLAERVSLLSSNARVARSGELPIWGRLGKQRSSASPWVLVPAWCGIFVLMAIAALRLGWHDGAVLLTWLNAFTLYVYLPAYGVLAYALWKGRHLLALAGGLVVACHVMWVAPDFKPATKFVPPAQSAPENKAAECRSLRIFYANVLGDNRQFDAMINEALKTDPDVIVFAELHRPWIQHLRQSEVIKAYPYGTNMQARHPGDSVVFSRVPVGHLDLFFAGGRACVITDIPLGDETVRLFCLHSPRPLLEDTYNLYEEFWDKVEPQFSAWKGPLVAIGDFNATQHSKVYQRLESGHLRSAHSDRGRGFATTWPNGKWPVPPIRIDQAFLSPELECVSIVEGVGPGSDHKPLILNLRVHAKQEAGGDD